tara:strand:+ start:1259 stop:1462 length:204 start_codon:yes stop_codon:yes gene_type:complete
VNLDDLLDDIFKVIYPTLYPYLFGFTDTCSNLFGVFSYSLDIIFWMAVYYIPSIGYLELQYKFADLC